jgi:uncharacterized membrane protein
MEKGRLDGTFLSIVFQLLISFIVLSSIIITPVLRSTNIFPNLAAFMYLLHSLSCHQMADRSFSLLGEQMPACARCFGIFLGAFLSLSSLIMTKSVTRIPDRRDSAIIILLALPMAVDGTLQLITPYESNNILRLITGLLFSCAAVLAFSPPLNLFFGKLSNEFGRNKVFKQ